MNPPRTASLHFAWLAAVGAVLVLLMTDILPGAAALVRSDTLFLCFAEVQLFFMVFLWPMTGGSMAQLALLLGFGLPPALVCANVSDAPAGLLLAVEALAAAWGALGSAIRRATAAYLLAASALAAIPPFAAFLMRGSPVLSPFGAVASARPLPVWIHAAIVGIAALLFFLAASRRSRIAS